VFRESQHDVEGIIDLVRDPCDEGPDGRHFLGLDQMIAKFPFMLSELPHQAGCNRAQYFGCRRFCLEQ
jgi:hypothetical protein